MADEKSLPCDLGDIDVEVANVCFRDGGADLRPDIGVEFTVFLLLLGAELDDGAVVFHFRLGSGFGCRVADAVDGVDFFHGLAGAEGKADCDEG